jgi:hypothetical protein
MSFIRIIPVALILALFSAVYGAQGAKPASGEPALYVEGGAVRVNLPWNMTTGEVALSVMNRSDDELTIMGVQAPRGFYPKQVPSTIKGGGAATLSLFYVKPDDHTMSGSGSLLHLSVWMLASKAGGEAKPYRINMEIARDTPILVEGSSLLVWKAEGPFLEKSVFFRVKEGSLVVMGVEPAPEMKAQASSFLYLLQKLSDNRYQLRVTPTTEAAAGNYGIFRVITDHPNAPLPNFMAAIQQHEAAPQGSNISGQTPGPTNNTPTRERSLPLPLPVERKR